MPEFDPRRASPGETFGFTGRDGEQHEIRADKKGVVRPRDAEEAAILDGFDLPVSRKAKAEDKAAEKAAQPDSDTSAAQVDDEPDDTEDDTTESTDDSADGGQA